MIFEICILEILPRMAPTVCEAEFPMAGTTINTFVYRRQRSQNGVKRRSFAREQMLLFRTRTINETPLTSRENSLQKLESTISNCSIQERNTTYRKPFVLALCNFYSNLKQMLI